MFLTINLTILELQQLEKENRIEFGTVVRRTLGLKKMLNCRSGLAEEGPI